MPALCQSSQRAQFNLLTFLLVRISSLYFSIYSWIENFIFLLFSASFLLFDCFKGDFVVLNFLLFLVEEMKINGILCNRREWETGFLFIFSLSLSLSLNWLTLAHLFRSRLGSGFDILFDCFLFLFFVFFALVFPWIPIVLLCLLYTSC